MEMKRYYLAIDIGASSGRHIVGWQEDDVLHTKEVYRFPNGVREEKGHLTWDVRKLFSNVVTGIMEAFKAYPEIESLSIDTWGVDYVLLKGDQEVYPVYAYRDGRTEAVIPQVHEQVPFSELYRHTGCQFQPFNTIYQLYDEKVNGRLDGVTDMLMMPEYLLWKLCGVKAQEYTNATTMGMVKSHSGQPGQARKRPNRPDFTTRFRPHSGQISSLTSSGTLMRAPSRAFSAFSRSCSKSP